MEAGDLLIFNSTQPHGIRPNRSGGKVRLAQYISMMPTEEDNKALRQWRITSWRDRQAPKATRFRATRATGRKPATNRPTYRS